MCRFQTIQLAIDQDCENILVNNYDGFYTDRITFKNSVKRLYGFDEPCVLNFGHTIEVANLDIRGMCFLHPGDQAEPLFNLEEDMETFWIRNCYIDGNGARGAGVIQLEEDKLIGELVMNHTLIQYWNFASFVLWNIDNVVMSHNLFFQCSGRLVDITYNSVFRFHDNVLQDARGIAGVDGTALVRFAGRGDTYRWLFFGGGDYAACSADAVAAYGRSCIFFNNVQNADVLEEDYEDTCYAIVGSQMAYTQIFNNFCRKAANGFQLRGVRNITAESVPLLLAKNSGIRPSSFRTTARENRVRDWVYDVYSSDGTYGFFRPFRTVACNFPCGYKSFEVCNVNPNYDVGYVPSANGTVITPFSIYQNFTSAYAYGIFHNASDALAFCGITRTNPYTGGIERPIYFTGERGGRLFRDSFDILQPGVSFYGALLANDTEQDLPSECFPRSQIYGDGWRILADNFTSVNISYRRDNRFVDFGRNFFSTFPELQQVYRVNFTNNTFDGGNLQSYTFTRILNLILGFDRTTYEANNPPRGGRQPTIYQTIPPSTAIIRNNTFYDFASFNATLVDTDVRDEYNTTIFDYPFSDPVFILFLDEDARQAGTALVDYNTFYRVDRRAVDIRYARNTSFTGNVLWDVGGLSPGNAAGVLILANRKLISSVNVTFNYMNNTREVLADRTISKTNPGYYASIYLRGYQNGTMCIFNNTVTGGAIGLRISGCYPEDILSCVNATENPEKFQDEQDPLRRIWFQNRELTGKAPLHDSFGLTWYRVHSLAGVRRNLRRLPWHVDLLRRGVRSRTAFRLQRQLDTPSIRIVTSLVS